MQGKEHDSGRAYLAKDSVRSGRDQRGGNGMDKRYGRIWFCTEKG